MIASVGWLADSDCDYMCASFVSLGFMCAYDRRVLVSQHCYSFNRLVLCYAFCTANRFVCVSLLILLFCFCVNWNGIHVAIYVWIYINRMHFLEHLERRKKRTLIMIWIDALYGVIMCSVGKRIVLNHLTTINSSAIKQLISNDSIKWKCCCTRCDDVSFFALKWNNEILWDAKLTICNVCKWRGSWSWK